MQRLWKVARLLPLLGGTLLGYRQFKLEERQENEESQFKLEKRMTGNEIFGDLHDKQEKQHNSESEPKEQTEQVRFIYQVQTSKNKQLILQAENVQSNEKSEEEVQVIHEQKQLKSEYKYKSEKDLQPNQVLVYGKCPLTLAKYFLSAGFTVIQSNQEGFIVKNHQGHTLTFSSLSKPHQLKLLANFIQPPQQITTVNQAKQLLSLLKKDHFLVLSYIPFEKQYQKLMDQRISSQFDTFNKSRKIDINKIEQKFWEYAYNSASNNDNYAVVRNPQVAEFLRMSQWAIGHPYLLNQTSRQSGGESNFKEEGVKYRVKEIDKQWSVQSQRNVNQINKITHLFINRIDSEPELQNKIRQIQMSGDKRKILLFFSEQHRQEFHSTTEGILEKVAKIQQNDVIIVKCTNKEAVRRVLKVEPDPFATIRLIDVNSIQKPLFDQGNSVQMFSRRKFKGPFKIENLCAFAVSQKWDEYYQSKRNLTSIKTIDQKQLKNTSDTLVLFQKQGCQGCKYLGESLAELKKIVKTLGNRGRERQQTINRYGIIDPLGLSKLKIRRISIFNDFPNFNVESVTPKLYLFSNGTSQDLHVQNSFQKLGQSQGGNLSEGDQAVLSDIIDNIGRVMSRDDEQI